MKKIMFICTGNICRSAMAHRLLEKRAHEEKKDFSIFSAGIFAENNSSATYNAIKVMKDYDVAMNSHKAINIKNSNILDMDLILCMTNAHKINLQLLYPELTNKIFLFNSFIYGSENSNDIKDPYGENEESYKKLALELSNGIERLLKMNL